MVINEKRKHNNTYIHGYNTIKP